MRAAGTTLPVRAVAPALLAATLTLVAVLAGCLRDEPFRPCDPQAPTPDGPEALPWDIPGRGDHFPTEETRGWFNAAPAAEVAWSWAEEHRDPPRRYPDPDRTEPTLSVADCSGGEVARYSLSQEGGGWLTPPGGPGWWRLDVRIMGPHPALNLTLAPHR